LTATGQKSVDHNPLAGKNPEKLVGHDPGKIRIPFVAEVDERHRKAHNGDHDQVTIEQDGVCQEHVVAVGNKVIREDQGGGDEDRVDPKTPKIIGTEGLEKIAEEDQSFSDIASRPPQEHFDHSAIG